MENIPPQQECSKSWCHKLVPAGSHKQCDTCRKRDSDIQKKHRAQRKATEEARTQTAKKCTLQDSISTEERPTQRPHTSALNTTAENVYFVDDDKADENPFGEDSNNTVCCSVFRRMKVI